jgi:hypothetical protein
MFHRLAPSPPSARLLHFATLAALVVTIAAAIAFALHAGDGLPSQVSQARSCGSESWPYRDDNCRDDATEQNRSIRLVSPDRIQKNTVYTTAARVEGPIVTPSQAAEPDLPPPAPVEATAVLPPIAQEDATPLASSMRSKNPAVSPKARAQAPRGRNKNVDAQPALGLGLAPRDKSYTGAGATFDAVH